MVRGNWCAVLTAFVFFYCDWTVAEELAHVRVMSFNIHAGRGVDGRLDLSRIARTIREVDPDLVALQEVDRGTKRSDGRDLLSELSSLTGMNAAFGKAIEFQDGEYGVGVLSRFEIQDSQVYRLPTSEGREQRVALEVRIRSQQLPKLVFVSTHFDHTADALDRISQARRIVKLFSHGPSAAIVAGDLNATPESAPIAVLKKHWKLADKRNRPTHSSELPKKKIDYILYEDQVWNVASFHVVEDKVSSDHRPVAAELIVRSE